MSANVPVAGPSNQAGPSNSNPNGMVRSNTGEPEEKKRRAYKACLNCRGKKAKCDLGELDNPKDPPCARCRREQKECVFAQSRRGGKVVRKDKKAAEEEASPSGQNRATSLGQDGGLGDISLDAGSSTMPDIPLHGDNFTMYSAPSGSHSASLLPSLSPSQGHYFDMLNTPSEREVYMSPHTVGPQPSYHERPASTGEPSAKRRKADGPEPHHLRTSTGTESFASASIHNPSDALQLLFQAADASSKAEDDDQPRSIGTHPSYHPASNQQAAASPYSNFSTSAASEAGPSNISRPVQEAPQLSDFLLVSKGIITRDECVHLIAAFFKHTHPIFPLIPDSKVPRTESKIAEFAVEESHLAVAIIVIASRVERKLDIHAASWQVMQDLISSLLFGKGSPTIGSVEALLILSENPPRQSEPGTDKETIVAEQILSWNLVGTAIRFGYFLSLDQTTFETVEYEQPHDNSNVVASQLLQRQRLAWTYCYLFDRQISIRLGKAFWSRGPGLCFQQPRMSDGLSPAASNFPLMRPVPGHQDDYASLLQAYIELTQIMTAAHDILFHSKDRTIALARSGSYYPYLDDFTRSLNSFKAVWENKKWTTCPLTDIVWITFHYLRQYIYGFAFQAHVQRATSAYSDGMPQKINLFERGTSGSPDAKFIFEAIDAAREILRICIESLFPSGALFYLPWRFFIQFCYAGVFLLKAVVVEAVPLSEQKKIVRMVKQLTLCLASVSPDDQHPGVRYARLLNDLIRTFSRGREDLVSQVATPYEARPSIPASASHTSQAMMGGVSPNQPFSHLATSEALNGSAFMQDGLPDFLNAPNPPWMNFDTTFNATDNLNWQDTGLSGVNPSEDVLSSMFFSGETLDAGFWQNWTNG